MQAILLPCSRSDVCGAGRHPRSTRRGPKKQDPGGPQALQSPVSAFALKPKPCRTSRTFVSKWLFCVSCPACCVQSNTPHDRSYFVASQPLDCKSSVPLPFFSFNMGCQTSKAAAPVTTEKAPIAVTEVNAESKASTEAPAAEAVPSQEVSPSAQEARLVSVRFPAVSSQLESV